MNENIKKTAAKTNRKRSHWINVVLYIFSSTVVVILLFIAFVLFSVMFAFRCFEFVSFDRFLFGWCLHRLDHIRIHVEHEIANETELKWRWAHFIGVSVEMSLSHYPSFSSPSLYPLPLSLFLSRSRSIALASLLLFPSISVARPPLMCTILCSTSKEIKKSLNKYKRLQWNMTIVSSCSTLKLCAC